MPTVPLVFLGSTPSKSRNKAYGTIPFISSATPLSTLITPELTSPTPSFSTFPPSGQSSRSSTPDPPTAGQVAPSAPVSTTSPERQQSSLCASPTPTTLTNNINGSLIRTSGTTHAKRHPHLPTIPSRTRQSDTGKVSNRPKGSVQTARKRTVANAIGELKQKVQEDIAELAKDTARNVSYVKQLVLSSAGKPTRSANLWNAKILDQKRKTEGQNLTAPQLSQLAKNDPAYENLSKEEEEELIQRLIERRAIVKTGVRSTTTAVAKDVRATVARIETKLEALHRRTGAVTLFMISHGHQDDTFLNQVIATNNASDFFLTVFHMCTEDVLARFTAFNVATDKGLIRGLTRDELRAECCRMFTSMLRSYSKDFKAQMSYANFREKVAIEYSVKLAGLPNYLKDRKDRTSISTDDVVPTSIKNPADLMLTAELRGLYELLFHQKIVFQSLSREEERALVAGQLAKEGTSKKRKRTSKPPTRSAATAKRPKVTDQHQPSRRVQPHRASAKRAHLVADVSEDEDSDEYEDDKASGRESESESDTDIE